MSSEDGFGEGVVDWKEQIKTEVKELRARIQALKKYVPKGDKKAKKEAQAQIDELEAQITSKQTSLSAKAEEQLAAALPSQLYEETGKTKGREKREKRAAKTAAQARVAREAVPKGGPDLAIIEYEKLQKVLKDRQLSLYKIEPDGHCLFAAVAHQMNLLEGEEKTDFVQMRALAADYILANAEFYVNFLDDEQFDEEGQSSDNSLESYCERIRSSALWGGHLELDALAKALKRRIEVLQAEGEPLVFEPEADNDGSRAVRLCFQRHAYTLGEHYDSLVPS